MFEMITTTFTIKNGTKPFFIFADNIQRLRVWWSSIVAAAIMWSSVAGVAV